MLGGPARQRDCDHRSREVSDGTGGQAVDPFTDVREIQRRLKDAGLAFVKEADESTTGPASFIVADPDGNPILFDQHR